MPVSMIDLKLEAMEEAKQYVREGKERELKSCLNRMYEFSMVEIEDVYAEQPKRSGLYNTEEEAFAADALVKIGERQVERTYNEKLLDKQDVIALIYYALEIKKNNLAEKLLKNIRVDKNDFDQGNERLGDFIDLWKENFKKDKQSAMVKYETLLSLYENEGVSAHLGIMFLLDNARLVFASEPESLSVRYLRIMKEDVEKHCGNHKEEFQQFTQEIDRLIEKKSQNYVLAQIGAQIDAIKFVLTNLVIKAEKKANEKKESRFSPKIVAEQSAQRAAALQKAKIEVSNIEENSPYHLAKAVKALIIARDEIASDITNKSGIFAAKKSETLEIMDIFINRHAEKWKSLSPDADVDVIKKDIAAARAIRQKI